MESPELIEQLKCAGANVVSVPVYRWRLPADPAPARRLAMAACSGQIDAITFTSAPAVHNLFVLAGEPGIADRLRCALNTTVTAACVGPVCADGARQEGVKEPLTPSLGRLGLLVRALGDRFGDRSRTYGFAGHDVVIQGSAMEIDGTMGQLTPKERAITEALTVKAGSVVSRETLLTRIWGAPDADPHLLEVAIGRLRHRLGPAGGALQAIPGRGYRFDVDHPSA